MDDIQHVKVVLPQMNVQQKHALLLELLGTCDHQLLVHVHHLICNRLKIDFLALLPTELALRVLSLVEDPRTLAHASQVSRRWHALLQHDLLWKTQCMRHQYHNLGDATSYHQLFQRQHAIQQAWTHGTTSVKRAVLHAAGLVTSLQLSDKYIVAGCDNSQIEIFDARAGQHLHTLAGHVGGVWALQFEDDTLVSGGCDRDVRVWDLRTGDLLKVLRGHRSTIRCLQMTGKHRVVTGSRDGTSRVWDIEQGTLQHVLMGHHASVRCLAVHQDWVASGSYDNTARLWDTRSGECLHELVGHHSQIYTVALDAQRAVTGSLDSNIRVWSVHTGQCLAVLQGHTLLVGHLQLDGSRLLSGGSDGCLRLWNLDTYECYQRISAHDNSVSSLQSDGRRIVSGGSDGRVKLWDLHTGTLIRLFTTTPARNIWKLQFNGTKAAIVMQVDTAKVVLEFHDFDTHTAL